MNLYSIPTGNFMLDGGAMFGVVPKSIWNRTNPANEHNRCNWAMRCLLVELEKRLILIDTGMGNKQDEKFFSHYQLNGEDSLQKSLQKFGFSTNDITDVLLTHLHFDHCGGAIKKQGEKLVPEFANATYWSNKQHWRWATQPNEREKASFLKENILPIEESGQLKLLDTTDNGLVDFDGMQEIKVRYAFGHTDAQMLPQINYKGKTIVFMADLLPSVSHIPLPYIMAYDMFPLKTLEEKKLFLEEAEANNYLLFLEHDINVECCTLKQTEKGIRVAETGTLKSFL